MTKNKKTNASPKRPSSPINKNNTSVKYPASQLSDEQLVNEMFAAPKPTVVVENNASTSQSSTQTQKPNTPPTHVQASTSNTVQRNTTQLIKTPKAPVPSNVLDPSEYIYHEDIDPFEENMDYEHTQDKDFIVVTKPTAYALVTYIP